MDNQENGNGSKTFIRKLTECRGNGRVRVKGKGKEKEKKKKSERVNREIEKFREIE